MFDFDGFKHGMIQTNAPNFYPILFKIVPPGGFCYSHTISVPMQNCSDRQGEPVKLRRRRRLDNQERIFTPKYPASVF